MRPYTNDTRQIIREAMRLTDLTFKFGIEFGKCGIILEDLLPESEKPRDLFSEDLPHSPALMKALDSINQKHGRNTLQMARMRMNKKRKQRSERKSPCYATRIDEVCQVYAR